MSYWLPYRVRQKALEDTNALLVTNPESIDLRFRKACLLTELGRREEAQTAYLELIARAPAHFGALNNFGKLLLHMGYKTVAHKVYMEAVKHYPDNPEGHVNFANVLIKNKQPDAAFEHFRIALRLDPDNADAHQGLAYLYKDRSDEVQAALHRQKGFQSHAVMELGYCGEMEPIRLLLLASAEGGMVPVRQYLDERVFLSTVLYVEYFDAALPLPQHHMVFNIIGEADRCQTALHAALALLEKTTAPVMNHPAAVIPTGRAENAKRLGQIPGVITAKTVMLPRTQLERAALDFTFPLLLRSPGFHTGRNFIRVDNKTALTAALPDMPGQELMVIQYLDARRPDGKIRKYRVMMIDGVIYPLHAAISHEWKIHYFSAEMADNPENRAEDAAFLENMPHVLGPRAMAALETIRDTLALDYAGADFSVNAEGDVILFEANATMIVNQPDSDARWDYRRPAVQRIMDAVERMLLRHAA